jgi:hypothetical protein
MWAGRIQGLCGAFLTMGSLMLAGCAVSDPMANPVTRNLGWFAHVEGADLRAQCRDGLQRYRFIYNARYDEQVRSYTILPRSAASPDGVVADLNVFVRGPANLIVVEVLDPLKPYRGTQVTRALTAADLKRVEDAVKQSTLDRPPSGLRLPSDGYYWTAAWCAGGAFHYDAVVYPSERWGTLAFVTALRALDTTGAPMPNAVSGPTLDYRADTTRFTLTVGDDGLVAMPHLY